jgi:MOSC domain-containing protein YiiM
MRISAVNCAQPQELVAAQRVVNSAIIKQSVQVPVLVTAQGLVGDGQADQTLHGGVHRAVYAYAKENYAYWRDRLQRPDIVPGRFGENLTTCGLLDHSVHIGDIYRIGRAVLEVTQPRTACYKLGVSLNLPDFPQLFLESRRVGFFMRVISTGEVGVDDRIECVHLDQESLTIPEISRIYQNARDYSGAERALRIAALAPEWREVFLKRLEGA